MLTEDRFEGTVLHLLAALNFGGAEKHMAYIWSQASRHRYRHVFASIGGGGFIEQKLRSKDAAVWCLYADPTIPRASATLAVFRLLRSVRPDIVHMHGPEPNFHGLLAAAAAGVPVRVGEEFALPKYSARAAMVFRHIYRTAHSVVCNCNAVREMVLDRRIAPALKIFTILNPMVIPAVAPPRGDQAEAFTIVVVARLVPHKNVGILVPALRRLVDDGVPARLWIVGDGPARPEIEAAAIAMGLENAVRFWGYRSDVEEILRHADVFAHPSLNEGSPLSIGEAMGCALPVVCTDVGGCAEMVQDGKSGYLVPPGELEPLVGALRQLWDAGPERRRQIGAQARSDVIEKCDPARYITRLEAHYDTLLAKAGRAKRHHSSPGSAPVSTGRRSGTP